MSGPDVTPTVETGRSSRPPDPAPRPSRWRARVRDPYVLVAAGVVVALSIQTVQRQWSTDYWLLQAVVDTWSRDLAHPAHPLVGGAAASEYYSPYTLVLAIAARATGWAPVTVLQIAAIANLVVFLGAFRLFVDAVTGRRDVAVWALVSTLVFWGPLPWRWSGFLNLNSIGFGLPYSSMFATGVALLVGWALIRYADTHRWQWLVALGAGLAVVTLTHPFTAAWTAVMLAAVALHRRLYRRETLVPLVSTLAVAAVLVTAWPYYPFLDLAGATDVYSGVHDRLYDRVPLRLVSTVPGAVVVLGRLRRDRTDPLGLMLVAGGAVYGLGWITGNGNLGRVVPLLVLPAHVGLGMLLAAAVARPRRASRPVIAVVGACGALGLVGVAPGLVRTIPRALLPASLAERDALVPITDPYEALEGVLDPGTVAVVERDELGRAAPAYGIAVLVPEYAVAFVDDVDERRHAASKILDPDTDPARRAELIAEHDVRAALCATDTCREVFADGEVAARGPGWTLLRLP